MARQVKIWFMHRCTYGYVNLNKETKLLIKQCDEHGNIYFCYLKSIEDKLFKYVKKLIAYGEIDERDYKWK